MDRGIRNGSTLTEVMTAEPRAFDRLTVSLIQAAEARGAVPETFQLLAEHHEARLRLIRQARSASIYPIAVLLVATAVTILVSMTVLPMLGDLLADMGRRSGSALPLPSRVLLSFSEFMRAVGWWLVPVTAILAIPGMIMASRTRTGRAILHPILMRFPVLGGLFRNLDLSRMTRTLGAMLQSGLDIDASLELAGNVLQLGPFRRALASTRVQVRDGAELSVALDMTRRFPHDLVALVASGEETGKVPEQLIRVADEYEQRVEYTVRNLGSLLQPVITICLGGLVLFIVLAVLLPYISLLTSLSP